MNEIETNPRTVEWLDRLQANGYRLTEPRRAVVETIALSQYVLSPAGIGDRLSHHRKAGGA